ncbi:MAG: HAMP domain-containing protein [Spirochaetales bacterium]|nr:HAMP domain-containing protein [Spirochaetales bacterium]MCF7936963.1 HAMP domain-containing protein [Spirochaetales bacterium]
MQTHSLKTRFLLITLLFFLVFAVTAGIWLYFEVRGMVRELGERYAVERVDAARLRLSRVLGPEAALARNLAHSPVIIEWMLNEQDPQKRSRAYAELASYRESFADSNSFVGILSSCHYYNWGTDGGLVKSELDKEEAADKWFFETIEAGRPITFNLDYNVAIKESRVWINCVVKHNGDPIGIAGTGLEITALVSRLVSAEEGGTSVIIAEKDGSILAHPDSDIMVKNAKTLDEKEKIGLFDLAKTQSDRKQLEKLVDSVLSGGTAVEQISLAGQSGLVAMTPISELDALVVASVDTSEFLNPGDFLPIFIFLAGTIILGLVMTTFFMQRLVLQPLAALTESAQKIAAGDYDSDIPIRGRDEIATLTSAFNNMTAQVRDYTQNLERKVEERTVQLSETNEQLAEANTRMTESIRYASLIQKGIMPDETDLSRRFSQYSLFFRERDIVGGDLLYIRDIDPSDPEAGFFLAVVDCEGHGVSGALMTMMTDSILEHLLPDHDPRNPAAILTGVEKTVSRALATANRQEMFLSGFDIGLCVCFPRRRQLIFAGAGMPLYIREPDGSVVTLSGRKKAVKNKHRRRPEDFENHELSTAGRTFFLVTDGFVDQSGEGTERAYGTRRLYSFFENYDGSKTAFEKEFDDYRGQNIQRDDVLAIAFDFKNFE